MSGVAMGTRYNHLTLEERCRLRGLMEIGLGVSEIARRLGRHRGTIHREVGLAVSRVTGIPTADEFWGHFDENNAICSPLGDGVTELQRAANFGNVGWVIGTSYTFRFEFTTTSLKVFVDDVEELNIAGTFNDGSVAFYNFPQANVTYSAFVTQPLIVDINIHPFSDPNPINQDSKGATPIIIWGSEDLDVELIGLSLLTFADNGVKTVGKADRELCTIGDFGQPVDPAENVFDNIDEMLDGEPDLNCKFDTMGVVIASGDTTATVQIVGCDDPSGGADSAICDEGDLGFFEATGTDNIKLIE
jgi:hypothetical protein